MSTHNIGFYKDLTKIILNYDYQMIKYHQICALFLLLNDTKTQQNVYTLIRREAASCLVKTSHTPWVARIRNCAYWSIGTQVVYGSTSKHFFSFLSPWLPRPLVVMTTPLTRHCLSLSLISAPVEYTNTVT